MASWKLSESARAPPARPKLRGVPHNLSGRLRLPPRADRTLPEADTRPIFRAADELDPGGLERPLQVDEGLRSARRDAVVLFEPFDCFPCYSNLLRGFSRGPPQQTSRRSNLASSQHFSVALKRNMYYTLKGHYLPSMGLNYLIWVSDSLSESVSVEHQE